MSDAISAVLFDLDGTLFDHAGSALLGVRGLVDALGGVFSPELAAVWFSAEERHVASWMAGECAWQEQRRRRLREFVSE